MHYRVIDHRSGSLGSARVGGVKRDAARGSHHGRASAVTDSYRVTDGSTRLGNAALSP